MCNASEWGCCWGAIIILKQLSCELCREPGGFLLSGDQAECCTGVNALLCRQGHSYHQLCSRWARWRQPRLAVASLIIVENTLFCPSLLQWLRIVLQQLPHVVKHFCSALPCCSTSKLYYHCASDISLILFVRHLYMTSLGSHVNHGFFLFYLCFSFLSLLFLVFFVWVVHSGPVKHKLNNAAHGSSAWGCHVDNILLTLGFIRVCKGSY